MNHVLNDRFGAMRMTATGRKRPLLRIVTDLTGVDNRIQLQFLLNKGWRLVHETRTPVEGVMGNELFEVSLILER